MPSCRVGDAHELASQRARRSRGHDDCQCSLIMMDDTLSHVYCSAQWTTWIENSRRCDCDALHCRSAHCTQLYTRPLCRDIRLGVGSGLGGSWIHFSGLTPRIPRTVYRYFWAFRFLLFCSSFFHFQFLVPCGRLNWLMSAFDRVMSGDSKISKQWATSRWNFPPKLRFGFADRYARL